MTKINSKTIMILTILFSSIFAMPIMARADDGSGDGNPPIDPRNLGDAFRGWGLGGDVLADILNMLFLQGVNFEDQETLDGVYVLNATKSETYNGTYNFAAQGQSDEYHFLPQIWNESAGADMYDISGLDGYPYCHVHRAGEFKYNLTIGASITFIIWDNDHSFVNAVEKIIDFGKKLADATTDEERTNILVSDGISLASWLITHINDIFTGDELFILNPITWQKFEMLPWTGFAISKTWYTTGGPDPWMSPGSDPLVDLANRTAWNNTAKLIKDDYMQWLLRDLEPILPTIWTHFQFELVQFWMKHFEIHIDLGALEGLSEGGQLNVADLFNGLDIEFYMFHHRLEAAYLYNDYDNNGEITVDYVNQTYSNGTVILIDPETGKPDPVNGQPVLRPNSSEITHQFVLGSVGDFQAMSPKVEDYDGDPSLVWGLRLDDAVLRPVPVGVDLNSYLGAKDEDLDYIDFNLRFIPTTEDLGNGSTFATGQVKLQHNFAPWNDNSNPYTNNNIDGLDLAIVYLTHIFHFHLSVSTRNEADTAPEDLPPEFNSTGRSIDIGNYLMGGADLKMVDIAGQDYDLGNATASGDPADVTSYPASALVVPTGLATFEGERNTVHTGDDNTTADDFSTDISLEIQLNQMYYGVMYPEFNGTGMGIWHDPTFNVYMVFSPESAGFWALILLVAGIGLVGIATIMIKKKKDREGF